MAEQEGNQQERTEPATPKRRQESREKGQVAKSTEVNSSTILLIAMLFLYFIGGSMLVRGQEYMQVVLENVAKITITPANLQGYIILLLGKVGILILPFAFVLMLSGVAINIAQVGFILSADPMQPKWSKINPLSGLKRIFASKKSVVELTKNIFKIVIVMLIAYYTIKKSIANYIPIMDTEISTIFSFVAWEAFEVAMKIILVFIVLAYLDYIFQKYDFEQNIKMTKQEVKDELKQMEGDPQIKARIRSIQRDTARQRMMQSVPEADVVITNPTSLAIAVKYDMATMDAPMVVAKGARLIAEKIRKIAEENDIPIVQDKPLAQALFKVIEPGDQVPEEFFQAVAEILAYVYKLKNKNVA